MKKITTILLSIFLANAMQAQSPNWLWSKAMGGTGNEDSWSVAIDPAGSGAVYTTGRFEGTTDFDPGAGVFNLTSAGDLDIFISKLDSSGNFVWAKAIGGIESDGGSSITIDPAGSGAVYTTGYFEGTVDFDPGAGVFNLTSAGFDDIFICKLDNSGNFVWAIQMGGTDYDEGFYIVIDTAGSGAVYTTGYFDVTADFDPGAGVFNLTAVGMPGLADIFISKLDSSGNFVWAKAMGGISSDFGYSIALDPAGSGALYTTGEFRETVDFDPGAGVFNLISAGIGDIYISKLDSSGNFVWAKAMGGTDWDAGFSIAIDLAGSGALYTTGLFRGTADFDPGAGVFNLTSAGLADIFISKLDSSGNFVWAKAMGGTNDDYSTSIAIDPAGSGDVYTTGMFEGTADFDPGAGIFNLTSAGGWDIFISKLDTSGNFVWAKAAGGTSDDIGNSIKLGASGHVYVTGSFDSPTISFDSTTLINADNTGSTLDIFIAKLDTMTIITGINEIENFGKDILLSPNPFSNSTTISFSLTQSQKVSLNIFDVNGRLITTLADKIFEEGEHQIEFNAEKINAGIYFLKIQAGEFLKTEKLIITK